MELLELVLELLSYMEQVWLVRLPCMELVLELELGQLFCMGLELVRLACMELALELELVQLFCMGLELEHRLSR